MAYLHVEIMGMNRDGLAGCSKGNKQRLELCRVLHITGCFLVDKMSFWDNCR